MSGRSTRVAVFIDWQNVYRTARRAFRLEHLPGERGNFSPFRLSRLLAAANGRGGQGELVCVEIHRGLPLQRYDPTGHMANRRQGAAWRAEGKHDTDLLPVPETIARLVGPKHIETASWASDCFPGRLRPGAPVVHHSISQKVFEAVETPVKYACRQGSDTDRRSLVIRSTSIPAKSRNFRSAIIRVLENHGDSRKDCVWACSAA